MPRKSTRSGDPASLLTLLWTPGQTVGRSGITLGAITAAALDLADADGLEAVTMRRVAEAVGVGAMTLYTYLPGRAELLELMLDAADDRVYEDRPLPVQVRDSDGWRPAVEYVATRNWEHLLAHRWIADVPPSRPILGPGVSRKYERELGPLDGIGLADQAMDQLLTTVLALVTQAARWQIGLDRIRAESRLTDQQWWDLAQPVFAAAAVGTELPLASRVGESMVSAGDPAAALRFGLTMLLDGVAGSLP